VVATEGENDLRVGLAFDNAPSAQVWSGGFDRRQSLLLRAHLVHRQGVGLREAGREEDESVEEVMFQTRSQNDKGRCVSVRHGQFQGRSKMVVKQCSAVRILAMLDTVNTTWCETTAEALHVIEEPYRVAHQYVVLAVEDGTHLGVAGRISSALSKGAEHEGQHLKARVARNPYSKTRMRRSSHSSAIPPTKMYGALPAKRPGPSTTQSTTASAATTPTRDSDGRQRCLMPLARAPSSMLTERTIRRAAEAPTPAEKTR
jgi:hypothetical protein